MVALAIVAMLWGNCFSCPEMLASRQQAHSCCPKPQSDPAKCHTQGMQHFVTAGTHTPIGPPVAELAELPAHVALPARWISRPFQNLHAPPEAPNIILSLRI